VVLPSNTSTFTVYRCALESLQPGTNCADKTPLTSLASLTELGAATPPEPAYFYDPTAQRIYLKLFSNTNRSLLVER
jgi:hypothetical protein